MDLFNFSSHQNLLPFDGEVIHLGKLLTIQEINSYFNTFLNSNFWKQDELRIYGKHIITARKVAWFGDSPFTYSYSNSTKKAIMWIPELLFLKNLVETKTGEKFNCCLLNLYHNGNEGMSWHSDDEKELGKNPIIASLSLGATRKFSFKHKQSKQKVVVILQNGDLLVMKGETQNKWLHSLPKTKKVQSPRINLTFRYIK